MDFTQRTKEESPIYMNMLRDAETDEDLAKAHAYGAKVDAFNESPLVTVTRLPYEGPDLSPGVSRPNSMASIGRGTARARIHSSRIDED